MHRTDGYAKRGDVIVAVLFVGAILLWPVVLNAVVYFDRCKVLRETCAGSDPRPWAVAVSAFLVECVALPASFGARVFSLLAGRPPRRPDGIHLVILVAGDGLHESSFWVLERRLRLLGWNTAAVRGGAWHEEPGRAATELGERLLRIREAFPVPVVSVLAFGCSGLLVRRWLRAQPAATIQQFFTLGTPHRGTLGLVSRVGRWRFLHPSSSFLRDLGDEDPVPGRFDAIAISSELDAWVVPSDAAYYPGAFNIAVRDAGHFSLLFSKRIADLIAENLRVVTQRR